MILDIILAMINKDVEGQSFAVLFGMYSSGKTYLERFSHQINTKVLYPKSPVSGIPNCLKDEVGV